MKGKGKIGTVLKIFHGILFLRASYSCHNSSISSIDGDLPITIFSKTVYLEYYIPKRISTCNPPNIYLIKILFVIERTQIDYWQLFQSFSLPFETGRVQDCSWTCRYMHKHIFLISLHVFFSETYFREILSRGPTLLPTIFILYVTE